MHPWRLALVALLLGLVLAAPMVSGAEGPGVVVLVHHPDDGIDPLGVPYAGADTFMARHAHHDRFRSGVDYPGIVFDGRVPYDGLPEPGPDQDLISATFAVYNGAVTMRHGVETPVSLTVADHNGTVQVTITSTTDLSQERLRLWSAWVEDPVHYEPPTGLTNGVFDHPFTVRAVRDHGPLNLAGDQVITFNQSLDPAWDPAHLHAAVWVQQDAADGRFAAGEVVQATMHKLGDPPTTQTTRGVLVEAYSATWCDPCLFGDRAVERLAGTYGLQPQRLETPETGYFQSPDQPGLVVLLAAGGFALLALARLGGRP